MSTAYESNSEQEIRQVLGENSASQRFSHLQETRHSRFILNASDFIQIARVKGKLMLVDTMGFPQDYDFVMLIRDIIDESYKDLNGEIVSDITAWMIDEYHATLGKHSDKPFDASSPSPLSGFVYLLYAGGFYKIGFASDVNRRVKQIQSSVPWKIEVVAVIPTDDMKSLEHELHMRYESKRVQGEWFDLDDGDVGYIKNLGGAA